LNPHLGRQFAESPLAHREARLSELGRRIWEVHVPLKREPVFHHRLLREQESDELAEALIDVLDRAGTRSLSLIVSLPTWFECADQVKRHFSGRLIYDCHDWLAGFANMAVEVVDAEALAMERADAVMFSSKGLRLEFERRLVRKSAMALVRNGVPEWPPANEERTRELVAGYIGAIEDWFELESMEAAARDLPGVRFVLVGGASAAAVERLGRYGNVEFAGEIPHERVPGVCASLRIGLIPFRPSRLTDFVDPIKLYEYFHYGLPVVSSRMPELDEYGDLIYQSNSPEHFVTQVYRALTEDNEEMERRRKTLSQMSTWHQRAVQVSAMIREA